GWSRTEVAIAFTSLSLTSAAVFPFAGRFADRIGTRPVLVVGYALLGLAIMALSQAPQSHFGFYSLFAIAGAVGVLTTTLFLSKLIAEWVEERRAFWMGVSSGVGNAVGASVMPIIAVALMSHYGWRAAFATIGTGVIAIGVPVAWFLLRSPPLPAPHEEDPRL